MKPKTPKIKREKPISKRIDLKCSCGSLLCGSLRVIKIEFGGDKLLDICIVKKGKVVDGIVVRDKNLEKLLNFLPTTHKKK